MVTNDALYDDNLNNVFLGSMTNSALLIAVVITITVVVMLLVMIVTVLVLYQRNRKKRTMVRWQCSF